MPIVESEFRPAWWLRQAHAQTLWPSLMRRGPHIAIREERVELPDGDFIDLAWSSPNDAPAAPIVMLLHGLGGSVRSHYVRGIMQALNQVGFTACLMHFRGCSGEPNRLPIAYHSGKTDDPAFILDHLRHTHGEVYGAVGVSLGGNVLLKWLGETGAQCRLRRAVAVSVPFVLDDAARRLGGARTRLYERYLVGHLQRSFTLKFARIPCPLDVDVRQLDTFYAFDDAVTAPLHGFGNVHDYYRQASSRQYIPQIRTPTLILHAADDPFMFPSTPPSAQELPPEVHLELTRHGGHIGFVSGRWPGLADYWAEQRIAQWMAQGL